jgi:hypothetical protein
MRGQQMIELVMACAAVFVIMSLLIGLEVVIVRLARTNSQLLLLLSSRDGNLAGTRALLDVDKPPQKPLPGVVRPAEGKKGVVMTYGEGMSDE